MDNVKMPFLTEETMRAQRVELYLDDLKLRLKELRLQHNEVIQNSVEIIKEIDQVSSSLLLPEHHQTPSTDKLPKIKQLIHEFETAKKPVQSSAVSIINSKVNIRHILQNFEKLNQCHVLKESLVLFKRAKESFEKIDTIIGNAEAEKSRNPVPAITKRSSGNEAQCSVFTCQTECEATRELPSHYASCCSMLSLDTFHSTEEIGHIDKKKSATTNSLENGYDGDNEYSEYDLLANIQKRQKLK